MPRPELIGLIGKDKHLITRYKRKLNDLVAAYREAEKINKQLEGALEKQQDKASTRTKELIVDHKKDMNAKDKLSDVIRRRNESLQGELSTLQDRHGARSLFFLDRIGCLIMMQQVPRLLLV
jgi:hypothetical protein